jgi:hypothetical protein
MEEEEEEDDDDDDDDDEIRIIKAAPACFGSHKTIIREPQPVLS